MNKIQILGQDFEILGFLEDISIADSFVLPQNKIGDGNGEAKLYIGQRDSLEFFFGENGFSCNCFLLKEDLINYIEEIRKEHFAPRQEYRQKDIFEEKWEEKRNKVLSLDDLISFEIKDQNTLQGSRLYVNSDSSGYRLIRELALPIISHLNITKLRQLESNEIIYYFYLFSDYTNDIIEEEEISIDDVEFEPFNPDLISIDTKKITMDTLLRRLKQGTINLNPDFQRNYVWTTEKKCQLIESLMLKIPLPMFYVSADEQGNYTVVDGLQRLTTIKEFIIDKKFKLKKLEFWSDQYDNSSFEDLPTYIENRILETEFTFTVINPGTPEVVKRNIFKRVNRGGAPLTEQEIRHALYSGVSTRLLKELASREEFLKATNNSIKPERMLDREFILRLLSFMLRKHSSYPKNGNMDTFLSDTLKIINVIPNLHSKELNKVDGNLEEDVKVNDIDKLRNKFIMGMKRSSIIFGEHAFRKSYGNRRKTPINKALFEVWGVLLGEMKEEKFDLLKKNKRNFLSEYRDSYLKDYKFNDIISRNALKHNSVIDRYTELSNLLDKHSI
ncbi:DUF262 domain-containing protein [Empedobacter falsenii]|uniref:DUF262 domain-containing protein n=1 Tax=Empedobacter falsenii TaxID=343874 RepID=UPI0025751258|nr:DUF262 domain-containing protein [Empedobacter falsenii]MDM1298459.1 DUF262 domain-containing protein [Empedobacter falsenii]MDM1318252.1 DUF262 domain-containing protein [Empedobacter falsenii]